MTVNRDLCVRCALLVALLGILAAAPAAAQYITFPRLGLSAAPDHYDPVIEVQGTDPFDIYVIVLPAEGEPSIEYDYHSFHWAILEACCGGAAAIVGETFAGNCTHEGTPYTGVTTTADECLGEGDSILLCTLSVQMTVDLSGSYFIIGGPLSQAYDCDGNQVVMTDMILYVDYTSDITPVETTSLSEVKELFR